MNYEKNRDRKKKGSKAKSIFTCAGDAKGLRDAGLDLLVPKASLPPPGNAAFLQEPPIRTADGAIRAATAPLRLPRRPDAARLPHGDTTLPFATACAAAIAKPTRARRRDGWRAREERQEEGTRRKRREKRNAMEDCGSGEEK